MSFVLLNPAEQAKAWEDFVNDPRGRLQTGFPSLDACFRRGGLAPGDFCLLGGRTFTRKTSVLLNVIANVLAAQKHVWLVALDEAYPQYIGKLMSAYSGLSVEWLETEGWDSKEQSDGFAALVSRFALSHGFRPATDDMDRHLAEFEVTYGAVPDLVCIDYSSLMARNKYDGGEVQRISRLIEGLQQWTKKHELVTIALHQVGRTDEGTGLRHHGDTPGTLAQLKYGGEEYGDVVLGTYRPALEPFGHMRLDQAMQFKGDSFDVDKWEQAKHLVKKYQPYTFLQLLKNRPGTKLHEQGVMLESIGESMKMQEADLDEDDLRAGL